jgi:DNA polymerase III epsilon subunit-like protein
MWIIVSLIVVFILYRIFKPKKKAPASDPDYKFGEVNRDAEKYCIVVDTETTGLIQDRSLRATKKNLDNFPRIVEIAWGVYSRKGELISEGGYLIKQSEPIPESATAIHGITNEDCEKEGCDLVEVLEKLSQDAAGCLRVVGHNVMFDKKIIESEFLRADVPKPFIKMSTYDTLQMGRSHFKIGKYPKLGELYEMIGGKSPEELGIPTHRAIGDVYLTAQIFFALKIYGNGLPWAEKKAVTA